MVTDLYVHMCYVVDVYARCCLRFKVGVCVCVCVCVCRAQVKMTLHKLNDKGESPKTEARTSSPIAAAHSPTSPDSNRQHDNYINYDIAQIVYNESRQGTSSKGEERARSTTPGVYVCMYVCIYTCMCVCMKDNL